MIKNISIFYNKIKKQKLILILISIICIIYKKYKNLNEFYFNKIIIREKIKDYILKIINIKR